MPKKIEISHRTIIFTVFFLLFLGFLYQIKDILLLFFVGLLLMTILNPLVVKMTTYRIPRAAAILLIYLLIFTVAGSTIALITPAVIEQTTSFVNNFPRYLGNIGLTAYVNEQVVREFASLIGTIPGQLARFVVSVFSNVLAVLTVIIFSFYLLLLRNKLDKNLITLVGEKRHAQLRKLLEELEIKLGGWARGQLTLMLLVGVMTYLGLVLLGVPYALPLAILAAILEIIPVMGPIIAAVPSIIVGFGISPVMGLAVAALTFLIQQAESYLFAPKIMESSAGISPVVTLLALSIGFRMAGIVGAIISLPVIITLQVIAKPYFASRDK